MKKNLTVAILTVFFISAAISALAADTTFSGEYRVRAWSEYNFSKKVEDIGAGNNAVLPSHENPLYTGFFDQRFRLTITHTRSEYLKAVIRMDIVEDLWGQQRNLFINFSNSNLINQAYLEFTVPPLGTFTVGYFFDGYGKGISYGITGTGIRWANKWGPLAASISYMKASDRVSAGSNDWAYNWDADIVSADIKYTPFEGHMFELYGGVIWDDDALNRSGTTGGVLNNSVGFRATSSPATYEATVGFVGAGYTGNIADMIDIYMEGSYLFGDAHGKYYNNIAFDPFAGNLGPASARRNLEISGWDVYADVSYYNDLFRVGVAFLMSSGQKHNWGMNFPANSSHWNHVNLNCISADVDSELNFANIITNGWNSGLGSTWGGGFGFQQWLENITAVKGYFEIHPTEKLIMSGAVIWAKWTEPVGWNWRGTRRNLGQFDAKSPAYLHPANYTIANYWYNSWEVSDDLGWEVDFNLSYEIMEGLTYNFSLGVLFTGDSWDYEKADGTRGDWGEMWSITNSLVYEF
ncbi:MAG: hypothetical protein JW984_16680 [Deltaproteobacteria bacterium]|uniref:Alginate export domain-containing protein n=1 Tax=Candidatus Zymogenus saltonus TaxID=2844893 RepID=A0A9D8PRN0_9DELT|nr:hypothetical protein [Candidatus Zymogenus saltonus]